MNTNLAFSPAQVPRRRAAPFSIRYQLRPNRNGTVASLLCRVRCNGKEDPSSFAVVGTDGYTYQFPIVNGYATGWDFTRRRPDDRSHEANLVLPGLEATLTAIYNRQHKAQQQGIGPTPTPQSVRWAYQHGHDPLVDGNTWAFSQPTVKPVVGETSITEALKQYISKLPRQTKQNPDVGLSPITIGRWERTTRYLADYVKQAGDVPVSGVRPRWAKEFHQYMITRPVDKKGRKPSPDEASRHLRRLRDVLEELREDEVISANPLANMKWPRAKTKPVYYLKPVQLKCMETLPHLSPLSAQALWWFRLMAYSGMDYPDAKRFIANQGRYTVSGVAGPKIVMERFKPPHNEFDVPILGELAQVLQEQIPAPLHPKTLNEALKGLGQAVGFDVPLTVKVARKTAGVYFLHLGYKIEEVSRILGHDSIGTTERYYVKVFGSMVDRGTLRLKSQSQPSVI